MDIAALIALATKFANEIQKIAPHNWKGNDAPNTHHFDDGSIVPAVHLELLQGKVSVAFSYTDGGVAHTVAAEVPLTEIGSAGPGETVTLDGVAQQNGSFAIGTRIGFFYWRLVAQFVFTDANGTQHDLRFDGELG